MTTPQVIVLIPQSAEEVNQIKGALTSIASTFTPYTYSMQSAGYGERVQDMRLIALDGLVAASEKGRSNYRPHDLVAGEAVGTTSDVARALESVRGIIDDNRPTCVVAVVETLESVTELVAACSLFGGEHLLALWPVTKDQKVIERLGAVSQALDCPTEAGNVNVCTEDADFAKLVKDWLIANVTVA